jgi:hypothetical protein
MVFLFNKMAESQRTCIKFEVGTHHLDFTTSFSKHYGSLINYKDTDPTLLQVDVPKCKNCIFSANLPISCLHIEFLDATTGEILHRYVIDGKNNYRRQF